jgi:hypothetical protein
VTPVALYQSIRAFDKECFRAILKWFDGTWRSLVARTLGVREVASSNLAVPTINLAFKKSRHEMAALSCVAVTGRFA